MLLQNSEMIDGGDIYCFKGCCLSPHHKTFYLPLSFLFIPNWNTLSSWRKLQCSQHWPKGYPGPSVISLLHESADSPSLIKVGWGYSSIISVAQRPLLCLAICGVPMHNQVQAVLNQTRECPVLSDLCTNCYGSHYMRPGHLRTLYGNTISVVRPTGVLLTQRNEDTESTWIKDWVLGEHIFVFY